MDVSSRDNKLIKEWRRLAADARFRRKTGAFAIEGARLCADAALSGARLSAVMVTLHAKEQYADLLAPLFATDAPVYIISDALSAYMSETASPQGVFAIGKCTDATLTVSANGRYLALEDVQDPTNMGTVIRTAEAMGVDGLLLSDGCCDLYNPKVLRGSMGGVFRLPTLTVFDMAQAVEDWQAQGLCVFACVVDSDAEKLTDVTFADGAVCLIGNEGNGLRPETIAACQRRLTIPMAGRAESLNASMAAGIVLWELTRGRATAKEG